MDGNSQSATRRVVRDTPLITPTAVRSALHDPYALQPPVQQPSASASPAPAPAPPSVAVLTTPPPAPSAAQPPGGSGSLSARIYALQRGLAASTAAAGMESFKTPEPAPPPPNPAFTHSKQSPARDRPHVQSGHSKVIPTSSTPPTLFDPMSTASAHISTASGGRRREPLATHAVSLPRTGSPELRRRLEHSKPSIATVAASRPHHSVLPGGGNANGAGGGTTHSPNVFAIESTLASTATAASGYHHTPSPQKTARAGKAGAAGSGDITNWSNVHALSDWFESELATTHAPDMADSAQDSNSQRICERTFRELLAQLAATTHDSRNGEGSTSDRAHLLSRVLSEWHRVLDRMARRRVETAILAADTAHTARVDALTANFQSRLRDAIEAHTALQVSHTALELKATNQSRALAHLHGRTDTELLESARAVTDRDVTITKLQDQIKILENKYSLLVADRQTVSEERTALLAERHRWGEERDELQSLIRQLRTAMHGMVPIAHAVSHATGTLLPADVLAILKHQEKQTGGNGGAQSSGTAAADAATDSAATTSGGGGKEIFSLPAEVRTKAALRLQSWTRGHAVRKQPTVAAMRQRIIQTATVKRSEEEAAAAAEAEAATVLLSPKHKNSAAPPVLSRPVSSIVVGGGVTKTASFVGIDTAAANEEDTKRSGAIMYPHTPAAAAAMPSTAAASGMPPIPIAFTELMRGVASHWARRHFVRVSSRRVLLKWIAQLYAEKLSSDQSAAAAAAAAVASGVTSGVRLSVSPFSHFVYAYYLWRHGAKLPAEMDLLDLFASLDRHKSHARIGTFLRFCNADFPFGRMSPRTLLNADASGGGGVTAAAYKKLIQRGGYGAALNTAGLISASTPHRSTSKSWDPNDPALLQAAVVDGGGAVPASASRPGTANRPAIAEENNSGLPELPSDNESGSHDGDTVSLGGLSAVPSQSDLGSVINSPPQPLVISLPTGALEPIRDVSTASASATPMHASTAGNRTPGPVSGGIRAGPGFAPALRVPQSAGVSGGARTIVVGAGLSSVPATPMGASNLANKFNNPNAGGFGGFSGGEHQPSGSMNTAAGGGMRTFMFSSRELSMELGIGLSDGAQSLTMRSVEFFLGWLDAARALGFGPLYTTPGTGANTFESNDGPCWTLVKAVDELFRTVFRRFPPPPLTAALDTLHKASVSKHTIKSLHHTPGAIDTKYVDFDVACDLAMGMFLAEDARLQDLLFVRFMSSDMEDGNAALGPKPAAGAAAPSAPESASVPVSGAAEITDFGAAPVSGAGNTGATAAAARRRLMDGATLFSLNHFTSIVHGMGLDWDDLHVLRVFQQSLQRRTDGTVTVDDFVYLIRAHGAMNVKLNWDVLGTNDRPSTAGGSGVGGAVSAMAVRPVSSAMALPLSVLATAHSRDTAAFSASDQLAKLKATSAAALAASSQPGGVAGVGTGRSMSLLQSGLADMRERMLELDTRWSHKMESLNADHNKAMEKAKFQYDDTIRVLNRDLGAKISQLESKLEESAMQHAVEYNALFDDHLKEIQQLIAHYEKHGTGAGGKGAGSSPDRPAGGAKSPAPSSSTGSATGHTPHGTGAHTRHSPRKNRLSALAMAAAARRRSGTTTGSGDANAGTSGDPHAAAAAAAGGEGKPADGTTPHSPAAPTPTGSHSTVVSTLQALLAKQETKASVHLNQVLALRKSITELKRKHSVELRTAQDAGSGYLLARVQRERDELKRLVDASEIRLVKARSDLDAMKRALVFAADRAGLGAQWVQQTLKSSGVIHGAGGIAPTQRSLHPPQAVGHGNHSHGTSYGASSAASSQWSQYGGSYAAHAVSSGALANVAVSGTGTTAAAGTGHPNSGHNAAAAADGSKRAVFVFPSPVPNTSPPAQAGGKLHASPKPASRRMSHRSSLTAPFSLSSSASIASTGSGHGQTTSHVHNLTLVPPSGTGNGPAAPAAALLNLSSSARRSSLLLSSKRMSTPLGLHHPNAGTNSPHMASRSLMAAAKEAAAVAAAVGAGPGKSPAVGATDAVSFGSLLDPASNHHPTTKAGSHRHSQSFDLTQSLNAAALNTTSTQSPAQPVFSPSHPVNPHAAHPLDQLLQSTGARELHTESSTSSLGSSAAAAVAHHRRRVSGGGSSSSRAMSGSLRRMSGAMPTGAHTVLSVIAATTPPTALAPATTPTTAAAATTPSSTAETSSGAAPPPAVVTGNSATSTPSHGGNLTTESTPTNSAYTPDVVLSMVNNRRASGAQQVNLKPDDLFFQSRRLSDSTRQFQHPLL